MKEIPPPKLLGICAPSWQKWTDDESFPGRAVAFRASLRETGGG
jgi:hypothetical protein